MRKSMFRGKRERQREEEGQEGESERAELRLQPERAGNIGGFPYPQALLPRFSQPWNSRLVGPRMWNPWIQRPAVLHHFI